MAKPPQRESTGRHAFLVASGILLSRLLGLVRQRVFSRYFGLSDDGGRVHAAFRIPNFLQNLFGEGVLSASFIPVYARLLAEGDEEEAGRVAGAVAGDSGAHHVGNRAARRARHARAHRRDRARVSRRQARSSRSEIVRILFPGAGLLVLSAWCLGILNSHRKFFLSYTAPVLWNMAMIATLVVFRRHDQRSLAVILAWGSVVGSALQFGVQVPVVLRLARKLRMRLNARAAHVRDVIRNFAPVFVSRGVVQISAYVDSLLASLLGEGAVAALTNAQTLYTLPVSLFGMAVSAAELPAMSSALGDEQSVAAYLRRRLNSGLRQIAFFIVPSAMGFLTLGGVITAALFENGKFTHEDSMYVWGILTGSAVGLLASTLGRLYSSTYYALRDTRTPLRFAVVRVTLTTVLGYLCAVPAPRWIGVDPRWGVAGLTASAGIAAWVEYSLLRRTLNRRIGETGLPAALAGKLWAAAAAGAAAGWAVKLAIGPHGQIVSAVLILGAFGVVYLAATFALGVDEASGTLRRLMRL